MSSLKEQRDAALESAVHLAEKLRACRIELTDAQRTIRAQDTGIRHQRDRIARLEAVLGEALATEQAHGQDWQPWAQKARELLKG